MDQAQTHARAICHDCGEVYTSSSPQSGVRVRAAREARPARASRRLLVLGLAVVVTLEANVVKAAALFLADYDKRAAAAAHAERAAAE